MHFTFTNQKNNSQTDKKNVFHTILIITKETKKGTGRSVAPSTGFNINFFFLNTAKISFQHSAHSFILQTVQHLV